MAKITIEELSDSLKEYLNGSGLTEAQVQELLDKLEGEKIGDISQLSTEEKGNIVGAINEVKNSIDNKDLSGYQEKTDEGLVTTDKTIVGAINEVKNSIDNKDLSGYQEKNDEGLVTTDKTIVGAINELFQSANNGKELIASSIGEPLSKDDTFSAMSNDINSLLSTFKTNMMNNGVTVESGDKFKQLIDKIASLADSEGKGIQYKTGNLVNLNFEAGSSTSETKTIDVNFGFIPNIVFIEGKTIGNMYGEDNIPVLLGKGVDVIINKQLQAFLTITSYNSTSITFNFRRYTNELGTGVRNLIYHAIGVGEEDTTLRDSLASILQEEGVSVTEEDDMASLISKVDEEFDRKNANAVSLISGTSYTLLNSTELDVYSEMINKEVLYTHNYPGGVIKFSTLIENMGRTDSDGWYTAYDSTYLVVNHIRNGKTISSVTYRHKIKYEDYGENEVEQSVDYIVENGDKLQFLGNAPQGVAYGIQYIKLTADIQW